MTLKEARLKAGIKSCMEASRRLEISDASMYLIEHGRCLPTLYTVRKIEKLYGVPIEDIVFPGEEKK